MKIIQLLEVWIVCFVRVGLAQGELGCPLGSRQKLGLEANFYSYPHIPGGSGPREPESWFLTGVKDADHLGTQYKVTQPNFEFKGSSNPSQIGQIYGFNVTIAHFALELTGYYRASATGNHTFYLNRTDDGGSFQLGLAPNTTCCIQDFDSIVNQDEIIIQHNSNPKYINRTVYLVEGYYYPVRLAYYNYVGAGVLHLFIQKPGESEPSDNFSGNFFEPDCVRDSPLSSSVSSKLSSKSHYSIPSSSKMTSVSSTGTRSATESQLPSSSASSEQSSSLRRSSLSSTTRRESSEAMSSKSSSASSQSEASHSIHSKLVQSITSLVSSSIIEFTFLSSSACTKSLSGYSTRTPKSSIAQSCRVSHSECTQGSSQDGLKSSGPATMSVFPTFSVSFGSISKQPIFSSHMASYPTNSSGSIDSDSQSITIPSQSSLSSSLTGPTSSKATMGSTSSQSIPLHNSAARNAIDRFKVTLVTFVSFLLL